MVYVHLAEGFEEVEAVTLVDILRRGNVDAKFVSTTGKIVVKGTHGIDIHADLLFEEGNYEECEMIVLPGGLPGTTNLQEHKGLIDKILEFNSYGKYIAAICAAPMVLGSLGIVKDKEATIYPGMEKELALGKPVDMQAVVSGNIVTGQAPGAAMEFSLKLLELLKGSEISGKVRQELCMR